MDLDLNFTSRTSEYYVDNTKEDDIKSLAKSYMTFKIGLCFRYICKFEHMSQLQQKIGHLFLYF